MSCTSGRLFNALLRLSTSLTGARQSVPRQTIARPGGPGSMAGPDEFPTQAPVVKRAEDKMGRNQPCWCGSGKKYKLCHGR